MFLIEIIYSCKGGINMNEIPKELQEAIEKCKRAQQNRKKRQQQYCIDRYYKQKEEAEKQQKS